MGGRVVPGTQSNRTSEEIYSNRADQVMSQWPGRARARCASKEKTLQNSLRLLLFILLLQPQPFRWDLVGTQIMRHPWEFELEFPLTWSSWLFWPHEEKTHQLVGEYTPFMIIGYFGLTTFLTAFAFGSYLILTKLKIIWENVAAELIPAAGWAGSGHGHDGPCVMRHAFFPKRMLPSRNWWHSCGKKELMSTWRLVCIAITRHC